MIVAAVCLIVGQGVTIWWMWKHIQVLSEYTESNVILHKATVEALAEIARIRRADTEPPVPATFIAEDV